MAWCSRQGKYFAKTGSVVLLTTAADDYGLNNRPVEQKIAENLSTLGNELLTDSAFSSF